ncbi:hypothetical protein PMI15_02171 [Polaromonas sp. CF318]|nr:hypothetical protein PMI15_02171 [Polaromonas sp. CF318]
MHSEGPSAKRTAGCSTFSPISNPGIPENRP